MIQPLLIMKTPLLGGFTHEDDKPKRLDKAKKFIKESFTKVDFGKLGPIGFGHKQRNENTIVSFGSKGGESAIFKKNEPGLKR